MSSLTRPKICTNLLNGAKYQFSTSSSQFKSHYDTLGITPKATQSDIKSAYYKLTKVYHPDKNSSEEAKHKFRNITDAYETLSNYKSRRLYDRGMRPNPIQPEVRDEEALRKEDAQTRFYRSRFTRSRVPAPSGRIPIYNFDEWAKAHYGDILDQSIRARTRGEQYDKRNENDTRKPDNNMVWIPILSVLFMSITMFITRSTEAEYDKNKVELKQESSRPT